MKYSVVVVDDETFIAKNIARTIETLHPSFEVTAICSCGSEAWEIIQSQPPSVVVTDIRMPEMDGLELVQRLSEQYPFIICVIISGYNDFAYAKKAISYQVSDYILKPINREELLKCLQTIEKRLQAQHPQLENAVSKQAGRTPQEIVSLVEEYIRQNYASSIDLASISKNLGFSSSYLTKLFSKYANTTPSRYCKEYRISVAKQLLADPSLSIAAISAQTGFSDQFHFSKAFKAETGISPTEYRQRQAL